jgi:hypothetical protein
MTQPDRPVSRKAPAKSAAREADDLRRQAENRLRDHALTSGGTLPSAIDAQRLLHELQVYQIELELQTEEL